MKFFGPIETAGEAMCFYLKTGGNMYSVFPGDSVRIKLRNGVERVGEIMQYVDLDRVVINDFLLGKTEVAFSQIVEFEFYEYSKRRPLNDRGTTGVGEDRRLELGKRLDDLNDSCFSFIESIWAYAGTTVERYRKVMSFLDENDVVSIQEAMNFVFEQEDFDENYMVFE